MLSELPSLKAWRSSRLACRTVIIINTQRLSFLNLVGHTMNKGKQGGLLKIKCFAMICTSIQTPTLGCHFDVYNAMIIFYKIYPIKALRQYPYSTSDVVHLSPSCHLSSPSMLPYQSFAATRTRYCLQSAVDRHPPGLVRSQHIISPIYSKAIIRFFGSNLPTYLVFN